MQLQSSPFIKVYSGGVWFPGENRQPQGGYTDTELTGIGSSDHFNRSHSRGIDNYYPVSILRIKDIQCAIAETLGIHADRIHPFSDLKHAISCHGEGHEWKRGIDSHRLRESQSMVSFIIDGFTIEDYRAKMHSLETIGHVSVRE